MKLNNHPLSLLQTRLSLLYFKKKSKRWVYALATIGLFSLSFVSEATVIANQAKTAIYDIQNNSLENQLYIVSWPQQDITAFNYNVKETGKDLTVKLPVFEIEGKPVAAILKELKPVAKATQLKNNVTEYTLEGAFQNQRDLRLRVTFQVSPDNPVLRFRYGLAGKKTLKLTKREKDNITYLDFPLATPQAKEVRFSEFNERFHATHLTETALAERHFTNELSIMGPMLVWQNQNTSFLVAFEHGSQYPD